MTAKVAWNFTCLAHVARTLSVHDVESGKQMMKKKRRNSMSQPKRKPGRPKRLTDPMPSGKVPFQQGLEVRQMTDEEWEKYGVANSKRMDDNTLKSPVVDKTLHMDKIEWFKNETPYKHPMIGFQKSGIFTINQEAANLMGVNAGDHVEVGLSSGKFIVLRKSTAGNGVKLRNQSVKNSGLRAYKASMVGWLRSKGVESKRYAIEEHAMHRGVFVARLK